MRYVTVGNMGVSVIGLGTWQFGSEGWGWGTEFAMPEARRIVERSIELGINVFDTAELYGGGRSEEALGQAVREHRDQAVIATKVTPHHLTRGGVNAAARRSLGRLGTGWIDLYQVHWPNPVIPLSSTMRGMRDLLDAGLVRHVGVSNFDIPRWRRAERALCSPVLSNQVQYSLLRQEPLRELVPYAERHDRLVIAYSPLAQGALSGKYRPGMGPGGLRARNALFSDANLERLRPLLEVLERLARAHGATPSQVALAWLVSRPNTVVIPGAKSTEQVEHNAAAADIRLAPAEWAELADAAGGFRRVGVVGSLPNMVSRALRR